MATAIGSLTKYPARFSVLSYAVLILLGASLLTLPVSIHQGKTPLSVVDAIFTATSALCVTGLTVRSTANDLSAFGQVVVLSLIQIGGIGIVTITTFLTFHLTRGGGLRHRAMASEVLGATRNYDLKSMLAAVLMFTLLIELIGFIVLAVRNIFEFSVGTSLWHALFHSVSAYCNAGFALHDDSLVRFQADWFVNLTIMALIVVGGIGFPVVLDAHNNWHHGRRRLWEHLHLHSKMMIIGTAILICVGALAFLLLEYDGVLEGMPWSRRILVSLFGSVTARTAGFNTVDMASLTNATLFVTVLLMVIGAGPCSTGGGMKVTTFMTLVLRGWSTWSGRRNINLMRRTVSPTVVDRAITVVLLFGAVSILAITTLLVIEQSAAPHRRTGGLFLDTVFEVVSALGTVGLSTGITGQFSAASRLVLVVLMFIGRLGPISIAVAISRRERAARVEYPEVAPLIG